MIPSERRYDFKFISQWKAKFSNINVFRNFTVYSSDTNGEEIVGPFLLDIDRTFVGGYKPDLRMAIKDTRLLVNKYCYNLKDEDYQVFFTGHKGFHIEINPRAVNVSPNVDRWNDFENRRRDINKRFGNSSVDVSHHHIRLHNSINSWIDYSGQQIYSMKSRISIDDLFSLNVEDISAKAENLARATLNG